VACGKKVYETFEHARWDCREVGRKHDEVAQQVYRCRECQAWHVGSRSMGRMRKPQRLPPAIELDCLDD
jgi:hypothetical protein